MKPRIKLATLVLVLSPALLHAQLIELTHAGRTTASLEAISTAFGAGGYGPSSLTYFLSGQHEVSPGTRLLVDLPFAHASKSNFDGASTAIGNPYLGAEFARSNVKLEIGLRVPMASKSNNASYIGTFADFDRSAFDPRLTIVRAKLSIRDTKPNGLSLGANAGPSYGHYKDLPDDVPAGEIDFSYGGDVGYRSESMRVGVRGAGLINLSLSGTWGSRSIHKAGVFGDFGSGRVRPGVQLSIPIGFNARTEIDWALGFSVQVAL
jgi:hypothetical protein